MKIFEDDVYEVFHKLDNKFKTPHACVKISMSSPNQMKSIRRFIKIFFKTSKFT